MMTQEEFMDVRAMKRQGMSIKEIAEETGYHPSTISGWLRNGGPPEKRPSRGSAVIDEHWAAEIAALVHKSPRLLATSAFELIKAKGYTGSYVSVARHLNTVRGPRFDAAPAASTRIVTAPGEEAQFDWSDISHWSREWGLGEVQCFSAILSFSRRADLVVRPLHRPRTHLRGPGPLLRVRGRCAQGAAHRPHGCARDLAGSALRPPPARARLRPVPRRRDPGLPGSRRQAQGEGGASLP